MKYIWEPSLENAHVSVQIFCLLLVLLVSLINELKSLCSLEMSPFSNLRLDFHFLKYLGKKLKISFGQSLLY